MREDQLAPRHPADGGGTVRLVDGPTAVRVGEVGSWTLALDVGPQGIAEGGRVLFQSPPFWGWTAAQAEMPEAPGYTSVVALPPGVTASAEPWAAGLVGFALTGRRIHPGETILLRYQDARADRFAEAASRMWLAVDGDGDRVRSVTGSAAVRVLAGPARQLVATWPSAVAPGTSVSLRIAALDADGNAGTGWSGEVALRLPAGVQGPSAAHLAGGDWAVEVPLVPTESGVYRVVARTEFGEVVSNPLVVRAGAPRILWGDLQVHTALSDGTGEVPDVLRYAREVAALDVVAITDHDHWGMRFLDDDPAAWAGVLAEVRAATAPGRFLALPGYEWTSWVHGHRHVVGFGVDPVLCSSMDPACDSPAELWAALGETPVLTFTHHQAGGPIGTDWSIPPDARHEPLAEISSVHGQSEDPGVPGPIYDAIAGNWVHAMLVSRRYTLGFIGSTDGHDGHPGLSQLAGGGGGLAAILAEELTPEAVYAALRERRTYATNGCRLVLRVSDLGATRPAGPWALEVRAIGTAPIARIELVTPTETRAIPGDGTAIAHHVFELSPAAGDFAYVRAVQIDGGVAWSSPTWFTPAEVR